MRRTVFGVILRALSTTRMAHQGQRHPHRSVLAAHDISVPRISSGKCRFIPFRFFSFRFIPGRFRRHAALEENVSHLRVRVSGTSRPFWRAAAGGIP